MRFVWSVLLALAFVLPAHAAPAPGGQVPAVTLRDEAGRAMDISGLIAGKTTLLVPVYFRCPNICAMSVAHVLDMLTADDRGVEMLAVSFDATETPDDARAFAETAIHAHPAIDPARLHFLTGPDAVRVMQAIGFSYRRADGEFIHPALAAVVGPGGRVAAWISTIAAAPETLSTALAAARSARTVSFSDFVLTCVHAVLGRGAGHDAAVLLALRLGAGFTVLALAGVVLFVRRARS
jgi:protein SCO1/2